MSPHALVVEFLGLPGVGKSHVNGLVAARLAALGIPVRSTYLRINHDLGPWRRVIHKSRVCAAELVRRPGYAWRLGRTVRRTGQRGRVDVVRLPYNWLTAQGLVRRGRSRPGAELLDEGMLQMLWSVGFAGRERSIADCASALLGSGASAAPMPDVVVLVDAPLDVILERLASRASRDGRVDRMDVTERRTALLRGADLFADVLSEELGVVGGPSGPLLRRVRNGDPDELDADLDALVRELASII